MKMLENLYAALPGMLPLLATIALVVITLLFMNWLLLRRRQLGGEGRIPGQVTMLGLTVGGIVLIVLALPVSDTTQGQLLALVGVALTATIALSSTTFASNAMAGIMLRAIRSYRPGDFVRVGPHFGRVTERGLFHTEIQTEDRDLTTLPNLYLVTHPVRVVARSGTIVSATVSLGYEVDRATVEPILLQAASIAELQEPFVQVTGLGDFSVTYRAAGFLPEVTQLLTTRSNLRKAMMDCLHGAGIEIVSPTYMNQRVLPEWKAQIPARKTPAPPAAAGTPEAIMFDKAERAATREALLAERTELQEQIKAERTALGSADDAAPSERQSAIADAERRLAEVENRLRDLPSEDED